MSKPTRTQHEAGVARLDAIFEQGFRNKGIGRHAATIHTPQPRPTRPIFEAVVPQRVRSIVQSSVLAIRRGAR